MEIARITNENLKLKKDFRRKQKWSQKISFSNVPIEKSIRISFFINNKLAFVGFDLETCGESVKRFKFRCKYSQFKTT